MTPAAFHTARRRTRCPADSRAARAAYRVLVDGLSRHVAAREADISASAVSAACKRIEAASVASFGIQLEPAKTARPKRE